MNFAWARAAVVAGLLLSACGQPAPVDPEAGKAEAAAFMTKNAGEEGVQTLPSGLQYQVVQSGPAGGESPDRNDLVKVEYEGKLVDGTVFDSSYERGAPAAMPLPALIPAWKEALQLMRPGDEWVLYVPPALGYGEAGAGEIPPNSVLIFRIELIDVLPGPGRTAQG